MKVLQAVRVVKAVLSTRSCCGCRGKHAKTESWFTRNGHLCPECTDTGRAVEGLADISPKNQHRSKW